MKRSPLRLPQHPPQSSNRPAPPRGVQVSDDELDFQDAAGHSQLLMELNNHKELSVLSPAPPTAAHPPAVPSLPQKKDALSEADPAPNPLTPSRPPRDTAT